MTNKESYSEYSHFFTVRLGLFDGPIDLLLHLVKQHELPIEKVSLAEVTEQYMHCIELMREVDLDIAGEYLVIAATLVSIKASVLLNEPPEFILDDEGKLVDPHEQLLQRLREAQIYRDGARSLSNRKYLGLDVFAPAPARMAGDPIPPRFVNHDPYLLGKAFRKLLERTKDQSLYTITLESVSIVDRMVAVLDQLRAADGPVIFHHLIPDLTSRSMIIGTFIALLELCKRRAIRVDQDDSFDEITIALADEVVPEMEINSEFDEPAPVVNE